MTTTVDVFRIRFFFPTPGQWHWEAGLNTSKTILNFAGDVTVLPVKETETNPLYKHGALRAASNNRYLQHNDGTPFFWLGDTLWAGALHSNEMQWEETVSDRAGKHFSVLQVGIAMEWAGGGTTGNWK